MQSPEAYRCLAGIWNCMRSLVSTGAPMAQTPPMPDISDDRGNRRRPRLPFQASAHQQEGHSQVIIRSTPLQGYKVGGIPVGTRVTVLKQQSNRYYITPDDPELPSGWVVMGNVRPSPGVIGGQDSTSSAPLASANQSLAALETGSATANLHESSGTASDSAPEPSSSWERGWAACASWDSRTIQTPCEYRCVLAVPMRPTCPAVT